MVETFFLVPLVVLVPLSATISTTERFVFIIVIVILLRRVRRSFYVGPLPRPLIDVLRVNPEQDLLLPQHFKLGVYDLVDLTRCGMRIPSLCVPLSALIVYADARIGPCCGSVLRPL